MISIKRVALSLGFTLALGFAFTPLGCGSSGRGFSPAVPGQGDAEVPEGVALQLRTCADMHAAHLGPPDRSVSFEVKLTNDGEVDSVALKDSTLGDEELELCMARALRSLSLDALPLRRSENGPRGHVAPESRPLLGQAQAAPLACLFVPPCLLTLIVIVGVTAIGVAIIVDATSTTKPKPRQRWKDKCTDDYVYCTDNTPKADCGLCLHICIGNGGKWPGDKCPR